MQTQSICPTCGDEFRVRYGQGAYCSRRCRPSPGSAGAISELLVAADLIRRGFYVFRNVAADGPCDLVAFRRGERPLKVEVKTAGYATQQAATTATALLGTWHEFDVLALVHADGRIEYNPPFG